MDNCKLINELMGIFYRANRSFLTKDENEILRNISERSLCSRLAHFINIELEKSMLSEYVCDVEYNRNDKKIKTIYNNFKFIPVVCDLIIHSRGQKKKDNLLALEMKKSTANINKKNEDRQRLIALTIPLTDDDKVYGADDSVRDYSIGIYYEINIIKKVILMEIYNGDKGKRNKPFKEEFSFDYYKSIPSIYL